MKIPSYSEICKPGSGAGAFFASILVWGVGIGSFAAVFNNYFRRGSAARSVFPVWDAPVIKMIIPDH